MRVEDIFLVVDPLQFILCCLALPMFSPYKVTIPSSKEIKIEKR